MTHDGKTANSTRRAHSLSAGPASHRPEKPTAGAERRRLARDRRRDALEDKFSESRIEVLPHVLFASFGVAVLMTTGLWVYRDDVTKIWSEHYQQRLTEVWRDYAGADAGASPTTAEATVDPSSLNAIEPSASRPDPFEDTNETETSNSLPILTPPTYPYSALAKGTAEPATVEELLPQDDPLPIATDNGELPVPQRRPDIEGSDASAKAASAKISEQVAKLPTNPVEDLLEKGTDDGTNSEIDATLVPQATQEAAGNHAVQFAALSSAAAADREGRRLEQAYEGLFGDHSASVHQITLGDRDRLFAVRLSSLGKDEARRLCRAFKQRQQDCIVVGP